jgi:hypothetical protein
MRLVVHLRGAEPSRIGLARPLVAGGSRADELVLPGCPPGALRVLPCAAGAVIEAVAAGIRVAGHSLHPGSRRLLRPGERAELSGAVLVLERTPAPAGSTRAAAAALLRYAGAGEAEVGIHLLVLTGPAAGRRIALGAEETLGRGRAASIVVPDPAASRVHARLLAGPLGVTVEDLGAKNGVRVNGVRIERRPFPVRPGDELLLGDTVLAVVAPEDDVLAEPAERRQALRPRRTAARLVAAALLALSAAALALAAG